jgi:hypothetical protein
MNEVKEHSAPLGLDFEWPEDLYGLRKPIKGSTLGLWLLQASTRLMIATKTEADAADLLRLWALTVGTIDSGAKISAHHPHRFAVEQLRSDVLANPSPTFYAGILLLDATGNELQRMYFR